MMKVDEARTWVLVTICLSFCGLGLGCNKAALTWKSLSPSLAFTSGLKSSIQLLRGGTTPVIQVSILNASSSVITSGSYAISLTLYADSKCTLLPSGTTVATPYATVTSQSGVATFPSQAVDLAAGTYYLQASSSGFASTCSSAIQVIGKDLVVPIEMLDYGVDSIMSTSTTFERSQTSLNTEDYDGTVKYFFEVVAQNTDGTPRSVSLVNSANTVVTSISVTPAASTPTRIRGTDFTPPNTSDVYRVQLEGTTVASNLKVYTARIIVQQTSAGKTKIFIPLVQAGHALTNNADLGTSVTATSGFATSYPAMIGAVTLPLTIWEKSDSAYSSLKGTSPWTLEVVMSSGGGGGEVASAGIYNRTAGGVVPSSVVSTTGTAPVLRKISFSDSASGFTSGSNFSLCAQTSSGSAAFQIYRAGLWVSLSGISAAEIYYRVSRSFVGTSSAPYDEHRVLLDSSLYSSPTFYLESTANMTPVVTKALFVQDCGVSDATTGGCTSVGLSTINVSDGPVVRSRSSAFSVTDGNRYIFNPSPGGSSMNVSSGSIVITIH